MLKEITSTKVDHFQHHYGRWCTLECGHKVWHRGSMTVKRKQCYECEYDQYDIKETVAEKQSR